MYSDEKYPLATEAKLTLCLLETNSSMSKPNGTPSSHNASFQSNGQRAKAFPTLRESSLSKPSLLRGTSVDGKLTHFTRSNAANKLMHRMRTRRASVGCLTTNRWESCLCHLTETELRTEEMTVSLKQPLELSSVLCVTRMPLLSKDQKHSLKLQLRTALLFIEAPSLYIREQWFHTLHYWTNLAKIRQVLKEDASPEAVITQLEGLVQLHEETSLNSESIHYMPFAMFSEHLTCDHFSTEQHGQLISLISRLLELEVHSPTPEMCSFVTKHAGDPAFAKRVLMSLGCSIKSILKQVKAAQLQSRREFITSYLQILFNIEGRGAMEDFFTSLHTPNFVSPHRQVFPNSMSIVLCGVDNAFNKTFSSDVQEKAKEQLEMFQTVVEILLQFDDWRTQVWTHLQSVPFPDEALEDKAFAKWLQTIVVSMACDESEEVRLCLLPVRQERPGWINLFAPGEKLCQDRGSTFSKLVAGVMSVEGHRRQLASALKSIMRPVLIMAVRGDEVFMEVISYLLEAGEVSNREERSYMLETLKLTATGQRFFERIMERQNMTDLMTSPHSIWVPPGATDEDVLAVLEHCEKTLQSINLENTHVTGAIARELIKFPALRHINLWSTRFDDEGLRLLCDYLNVETLKLCETPVTDEGLEALAAMTNLKSLNINSTRVSGEMYLKLKKTLPDSCEFDIGYTDADGCDLEI